MLGHALVMTWDLKGTRRLHTLPLPLTGRVLFSTQAKQEGIRKNG